MAFSYIHTHVRGLSIVELKVVGEHLRINSQSKHGKI